MAFSLIYLGLCRIFGLVKSARGTEFDKDVELMVLRHEVHILERQVHGRGTTTIAGGGAAAT
ncbi:MAG: hypothetical protein ACLQPH_04775, partial [Acidimicrobiales bacterium]